MGDRVGQQLGNYRIERRLAQGGFGEVYLGEHIHLGVQAAIKVLNAQLIQNDVEQFRTEARTIARLNHPNIQRLLEYGTEADTPYLVSEYAPYGTLRYRHPRGSKVPLPTVVEYVKQMAKALDYAHAKGVIHRDVKPENILQVKKDADNPDSEGKIRLGDFGIARLTQTSRSLSIQDVADTASYMAPEQFQGKPRPASDQYSLGVVVYEWLCGMPPFEGNIIQLAYQHSSVLPPSLTDINPTIPRGVEQVVLRALAKDPRERFLSVLDFAQALEQASRADLTPPTMMPPPPPLFQQVSPIEPEVSSLEGTEGSFKVEEYPNDLGSTGLFTRPDVSSKNLLPRSGVEEQPETQLSLYALASARLEADDRALIGKQYTLEAGLAQQRPDNFVGEPFRVAVRNPTESLLFHVMLHASPNIQLLGAWYQPLRYAPLNVEPQSITCPFRLTAGGESYLLINFYRDRQWLKSIRLEFEGIEQTSFSTATNWR